MSIKTYALGGNIVRLYDTPDIWMPTDFAHIIAPHILKRLDGQGQVAVELGLGPGTLSIPTGMRGYEVVGLDINPRALTAAKANWELNGLPSDRLHTVHSDLFSGLPSWVWGRADHLYSNPPTFPGERASNEQQRDDFEKAGPAGRLVLDAVLTIGPRVLRPGGRMVVIATSRQGRRETKNLLDTHWSHWTVVETRTMPLAEWYLPYVPLWRNQQETDGEERIFLRDGHWHYHLDVIEAWA